MRTPVAYADKKSLAITLRIRKCIYLPETGVENNSYLRLFKDCHIGSVCTPLILWRRVVNGHTNDIEGSVRGQISVTNTKIFFR
jgi:hypothetical protein